MCEQMLNKVIEEKLGITDEIPFHRVHCMGRKQTNKYHPIAAKFFNFKNRNRVRKNFYMLRDQNDRKYSKNSTLKKSMMNANCCIHTIRQQNDRGKGPSWSWMNYTLKGGCSC